MQPGAEPELSIPTTRHGRVKLEPRSITPIIGIASVGEIDRGPIGVDMLAKKGGDTY